MRTGLWSVVCSQWFVVITFLFLLSACSSNSVIINGSKVNVEIADSPEEHQKGLMFHGPLKENEGMLFIFPDESKRSFWMKNVFFPIDIVFLNSEKKVVDLKDDFYLCVKEPCELFTSKPAKYAIELQRNFIEKHNVKVGDLVEV
ncbi:MAG: DUF192 domain-containing protein [Nanoarchaeota archaeon]